MAYTGVYNSATAGNFDTDQSAVAAGQTIAGLTDLRGGRLSTSGGIASLVKSDTGGFSGWAGLVSVPGSDAQLNSLQIAELPANPASGWNVGMVARAKPWGGGDTRYQFLGVQCNATAFNLYRQNTAGGYDDVVSDTDMSWYDSTKAYQFEFEVTDTNPATFVCRARVKATGIVARTVSSTSSDTAMQTVGLCGLLQTALFSSSPAGPTPYASYTVGIEAAAPPLTATLSGTPNTNGTVSISVTPSGGTGSGNYSVSLYGVANSVNFTPGSGNLISTVSTAENVAAVFTPALAAGAYKGFRATVTRNSATATAQTAPSDVRALSDYLIMQGGYPSPGALPTLKTEYASGCIVVVAGNSFIAKRSDTGPFSNAIKAYLEANGVGGVGVKTTEVGFPGSSLGGDWGAASTIYDPGVGHTGPTGETYGAYGLAGNDSSKNLLANLVDRITAIKAAFPSLPCLVFFYELTNAAIGLKSDSAIAADFADIKAAVTGAGAKLILEGAAWLTPASSSPPARTDKLLSGFAACAAVCDGLTAYTGDTTWLAYSQANASAVFYGGDADGSGIHESTTAKTTQGTRWAEQARRGLMATTGVNGTGIIMLLPSGPAIRVTFALALTVNWDATAGATQYDVRKNGTVVSANQAGTTYSGTFEPGDKISVTAKDSGGVAVAVYPTHRVEGP